MCCDQIVCIENIVDLQATYSVLPLSLSRLISDIIKGCKQDIINVLDMKVFLYALRYIPFTDEEQAREISLELAECVKKELYAKSKKWSVSKFLKKISSLQELIMWDYLIAGSLIMYNNEEIVWDLNVSFIQIEGYGKLFSVA